MVSFGIYIALNDNCVVPNATEPPGMSNSVSWPGVHISECHECGTATFHLVLHRLVVCRWSEWLLIAYRISKTFFGGKVANASDVAVEAFVL